MSLILLVSCMLSSPADSPDPARPNILWLIAEDLGPHLGCNGTKEVWTENLDRLAADGMRFTRCFTTAPVCSPSRSAFMTGYYATTIGAHNHRSHRDDGYELPDGVRVLTDWFRDAGYFTANLRELPSRFEFRGKGKTDWNFTYHGKPFDSDRWADLASHQPFFAQINFHETHRKFHAAKRANPAKVNIPPYYPDHPVTRADWAEYLDSLTNLDGKIGLVLKQLELDGLANNTIVVFFGDNGQAHVRGKQFCYDTGLHVPLIIRWPVAFPPPAHFRAGSVSDRLIAAIDIGPTMLSLAGAKRVAPLKDCDGVGSLFLRSAENCVGSRPPAASPTSRKDSRPHWPEIPSARTVLEVPGAATLARFEGEIFLGDDADPPREYVFGARDRCDETVFRFRTVRDARYRYIRNFTPDRPFLQANQYKENSYPVWNLLKELHAAGKLTPEQDALCAPTMPPEELYDFDADSHEIHNLAKSASHRDVLARLRAALERWIDDTHDQGRELEPAELAAAKGITKPGTNPNQGYTLDGDPPGATKKK